MQHLKSIGIFILLLVFQVIGLAQPVVNERYEILGESNSIFGSVIATDSCYYIAGVHLSAPGAMNRKGSFIKFNLDGSINHVSSIESDTMGIDLRQGNNLIKTLDGNFAYYALCKGDNSSNAYSFIKLNPNGDNVLTNYHYDFYENDLWGLSPSSLIQNSDSSYYGIVSTSHVDDFQAVTVFYKLDKIGNLLFYRTFYGISATNYRILRPRSLVKIDANTLIIGASMIHVPPTTADKRFHTKLIVVDSLGELKGEHLYSEDDLAKTCNGLTKTIDDGLLYCGTNGQYYPLSNVIGYRARIVKLNSGFEVDWELEFPDIKGETLIDLYEIKALNNTEFVAVGWNTSGENKTGWLVKFNLDGELIWERKYIKLPTHPINTPTHILYDIDITSDSGFVMVGQSNNFNDADYLMGQKAWLLKTDKYGCLVPNCHLIGEEIIIIDSTEWSDTIVNPPPFKKVPEIRLFPNPATNTLFYYHYQAIFQFGTAYIYSPTGEIVQKWEITENAITYEIDISDLAAGNYLIKIFNALGQPLVSEQFVKI